MAGRVRAILQRVRRRMVYVAAFGLLACVVIVALPASREVVCNTVGSLAFGFALKGMTHRLPFRQSDFETVVAHVEDGELVPDSVGVVDLPPQWAHLTQDGKVYVSQTDDGNVLMTFVTWRGRHFNFEGYMHSATALREDALATDSFIRERGFVGYLTMQHPGTSYPPDWEPAIDPAEELSATVERRIEGNWYFISYRLD